MPIILNNNGGNNIMPGEAFSLTQNGYGKTNSTTLTVGINDLIIVTNNVAGNWPNSDDLTTQISSGATLIRSFIPRPNSIGTGVGIWKAINTSITINFLRGQYGFGVYRNSIYSDIVYKDSATDIDNSAGAVNLNNVTNGDIFIAAYSRSGSTITPWQIGLTGISSRGDFITRALDADGASMTILGVINDDSHATCIIPGGKGGYAIFSVN